MHKLISGPYQYLYRYFLNLSRPFDLMMNRSKWYSDIPPDFLIIGLQKSGTSWIVSILNNCPGVRVIPSNPGAARGTTEGHFFDTLAEIEKDPGRFKKVFSSKHHGFFRDLVKKVDVPDREGMLKVFSERYNAFLQRQKDGPADKVGDKTTEYVLHLDLVDSLYPGIKKICILRDPRDRIVSFHFHQIRKKRITHEEIKVSEIEDYCDRLEKELNMLINSNGGIKFITYESLSSDPAAVTKDLLNYIGVSALGDVIDEMIRQSTFKALSGRERGLADSSSHYRKGITGDWKNHLKQEHLSILSTRIDPLLKRFKEVRGFDVSAYIVGCSDN